MAQDEVFFKKAAKLNKTKVSVLGLVDRVFVV
jgi:hypothetical protein